MMIASMMARPYLGLVSAKSRRSLTLAMLGLLSCFIMTVPLMGQNTLVLNVTASVASTYTDFSGCPNYYPGSFVAQEQLQGQFTVSTNLTWAQIQQALASGSTVTAVGQVTATVADVNSDCPYSSITGQTSAQLVLVGVSAFTPAITAEVSADPVNGCANDGEGTCGFWFSLISIYEPVSFSASGLTASLEQFSGVGGNSGSLTVTVEGSGSTLTISTSQLAPATVGQPYGPVQLQATGGTPPYVKWAWTGDMLPAGMQLTAGGVLRGTPQRADTYQMHITVTD